MCKWITTVFRGKNKVNVSIVFKHVSHEKAGKNIFRENVVCGYAENTWGQPNLKLDIIHFMCMSLGEMT